jgi:NAD(P)-dependent dehydrogenase (short-subunit alcohol dehydrogenase family)
LRPAPFTLHLAFVFTPQRGTSACQPSALRQRRRTCPCESRGGWTLVGRLGDAEEVTYAVLYLASGKSKFVTGAEIVIDGGFTAREGDEKELEEMEGQCP